MNRKLLLVSLFVFLTVVAVACSSPEAAVDESQAPVAEEAAAEESQSEEAEQMDESDESPAADAEDADEAEEMEDSAEASDYDSEFPLPEDVQNFMGGEGTANFATSLTVEEAIEFYRGALINLGLSERGLNTAITETTFSLVFDGHENGKAVVVQGVDLGNGTTNINIRFEDV